MRDSEQRKDMIKDMIVRWFLVLPAVALVGGLVSAVTMPAHGAPLDPPACEQLQLKLDGLRRDGVEADMALGAAQAKSTLPAERLSRISVFIETEEQLNFRCGLAKQHIILPTTIEGGEEELPGPTEGAPGAMPLPQRAPRAAKEATTTTKGNPAAKAPAAAVKAPAAGTKAPAESAKRRPAATKAKEASAATAPPGATPAAKPPATEGEARPVAKKKTVRKSDDAYRPPAKPAVREETAAPAAKQ